MADDPKKPDQEGNEGGLFTTLSSKVKSPGELNKELKETQVWKSIFRHKLDDSPRNRSLAVLSNVQALRGIIPR